MADLGILTTKTSTAIHGVIDRIILWGAALSYAEAVHTNSWHTQPDVQMITEFSGTKKLRMPAFGLNSVWPDTKFFNTQTGHISGIVRAGETILANRMVRLYYKPNGQLISETLSDENGLVRFEYLEHNTANYTIIAYNEGYNAVIVDGILPVNASGSL